MGITKSSHLIALGAFDASSGSGGSASAVTLLSITTEPSAPFAKGSKYFNSTDNKIYTAIADDVWGIKGEDPSFVAYYVYNGETYTWDGNSMEPFELENYQKVSNLKTTIEASTISNNFYPSTSAVANFVFDQGIAHNFSEVKIPNTEPQETLNDYTSSSYTFLDLAQKIQLCQLTMGTILYGEVRNQGMPTGIGNAELRVEVLETKGNGKQVLLFTLFSTNVAPNMWTYIYFQGQTDDAVVWTPRAISTNDYTSTSMGTVPTSKALSDGLATKQDTLPSQTGNAGKSLMTDGTDVSWQNVEQIKEQNANELIKYWYGTQNEYDNLNTYDVNTNYIIVDNSQTISTLLATQAQFNNSAQDKAATPYQVNQVLNNYTPASLSETITSTSPSLTLSDNTFYNCTNALTSLTITSIPASNMYGIEIHFTTDAGFSGVTFPAGTLYTGTLPTWEANKSYLISISRNVVVAAEIKTME